MKRYIKCSDKGYRILTDLKVGTYEYNTEDPDFYEQIYNEQVHALELYGYDYDSEYYLMVFDNNQKSMAVMAIDDAIERLDTKDGIDLVEFDSGFIGFVGYYNNFPPSKNCFEIICPQDEIIDEFGHLYPYNDAARNSYDMEYSDEEYIEELVAYMRDHNIDPRKEYRK